MTEQDRLYPRRAVEAFVDQQIDLSHLMWRTKVDPAAAEFIRREIVRLTTVLILQIEEAGSPGLAREREREIARVHRVCTDWQAGRVRWPDAVAVLGLAGLPQLYAVAYRSSVEIRCRFADEVVLPDLGPWIDIPTSVWRANPGWQSRWFRDFDQLARETYPSRGAGFAMRVAEWIARGRGGQSEELALETRRRMLDQQKREAADFSEAIRRRRDDA